MKSIHACGHDDDDRTHLIKAEKKYPQPEACAVV